MKHIWNKISLERIYILLLLIIFGGIVLQAPISVGFGTLFPHYQLVIKAWAEILMTLASGVVLILLARTRQFAILKDPILILAFVYVVLHIILLPVFWHGVSASVSGLIIDLRYIVFFGFMYIALRLYPNYRPLFIKTGVVAASAVLLFALLQVTILPVDVLKYIGYNTHTIVPYLTVDQNASYIRINSTLRGPNPLGAYALIVLTLLLAAMLRKPVIRTKLRYGLMILAIGGIIVLWASYSRSALLAAIVSLVLVVLLASFRRISRRTWVVSGSVVAIVFVGIFLIGGSSFVSNVVLHDNPEGGSISKSDDGHASSLINGTKSALDNPLGSGIGSTGSASLYTQRPVIVENQYLFIVHETGWLGLILFVALSIRIFKRLWFEKSEWLSLGVFSSGIGLLIIGLLLPVWVDDTVSILWWGLAGIALGAKRG